MDIIFLNSANSPSSVAVSSARTCYSSKGVVLPDASNGWSRKDTLLNGLFNSGHHTTLQHTYITMVLPHISRHLVWRLLHSHSFYNSEQVSQRYAKMTNDGFVYPSKGDKKDWKEYYSKIFNYYEKLKEELEPIVDIYTTKNRKADNPKKAMEFARYLLPQGCATYLYHTVNLLTMLRYISLCKNLEEASFEAKEFGSALAKELIKLDSSLEPLVTYAQKANSIMSSFDMNLFKSKYDITDEQVKVYETYGELNFDFNSNYSDILKTSQLSFDSGMIGGFNSYVKLSLSADAQNQRHRRSTAVRPKISDTYKKDYYIPEFLNNHQKALDLYNEAIDYSYNFFAKQRDIMGFDEAIYALPNAHNIEIIEKNDFTSFAHKAQMRLCFNAQEEIYQIVNGQVKELDKFYPNVRNYFMSPCSSRVKNNIKPICPEGRLRYCGVKVWEENLDEYKRLI